MGRALLLRDKRKVNFELDTRDFIKCYEVMARHGLTISEFGRDAFNHYANKLDLDPLVPNPKSKISLALDSDDMVDEIQSPDPQPEPTPIGDILNYKK